MSKKDLLERISRSGTSKSSRTTPAPAGKSESTERSSTTKRVSRRVVRRRPARGGADAGSSATPRRRRVAVDEEAAKKRAEAEAKAAAEREAEAARQRAELEKAAEAKREAEAKAKAQVEAQAQAKADAEAKAQQAAAAKADEPAAQAQEPAAKAEAKADEPAAKAEEPAAQAQEPAAKAEAKAQEPAQAQEPAKADEPADAQDKEKTRFAGLGSAVVKPPPGYDPTNPEAWRRRMEKENAPSGPRGRVGGVDAGAAGKTDTSGRRGRRRVASGGSYDSRRGRKSGRGGRRGKSQVPGDMLRRRRGRRKGGGGGTSTVAMKAEKRKVRIDNVISVGQLAHEMGLKATVLIRSLMEMGSMVTVNQMLDFETATLVANEFEYETENVGFQEDKILQHFDVQEDDEDLEPRPAVITIMGHVDHGKTTLLDTIRKARVAKGEAGGITQHIGAYQVEWNDETITFLDTPGHAAFTSMRARGAEVTDIVVLVVAADDGVQPQTVEAINHAKAADVPIIVAVNKMDKPGASAEPIMQELTQYELVPEDWGGDVQFVPISALKGEGIDDLLEAISLLSEVQELEANPDRPGEGTVIEAKVERGRGPVASVLVQKGTLKKGDNVVLGSAFGRVRAMTDHRGKRIKKAGPSTPVELFGISEVPSVGDVFTVVKTEKDARAVADHRAEQKKQASFAKQTRATAEDLFAAAAQEDRETLMVVLKGDVQGSVEAIKGALEKLDVDGTELRILHSGVGNINESDVNLVTANGGLLLGFNVRIDANARKVADEIGVKPELFNVIYGLLDRVEAALNGLVEPEYEEVRKGAVEVRAIFKISRIGTIAGCYVTDGVVGRNMKVKVMREGNQLWEGNIGSLKRFKDDVREVKSGYECGISLDGFNDIEEGDIFEVYAMEQVAT